MQGGGQSVFARLQVPLHLAGHGTQPGRGYAAHCVCVCVCVLGGACSHLPLAGFEFHSLGPIWDQALHLSSLMDSSAFQVSAGCRLWCCGAEHRALFSEPAPAQMSDCCFPQPPCLSVPRGHPRSCPLSWYSLPWLDGTHSSPSVHARI